MMPLIDVIFLLLTFFIYALVVIDRFEILPIELAAVPIGEGQVSGEIHTVTLDEQATVYLDREAVDLASLRKRFAMMAKQDPQPQVFVALGRNSAADRAPVLVELIIMAEQAGLKQFAVVGPKGGEGGEGRDGGE